MTDELAFFNKVLHKIPVYTEVYTEMHHPAALRVRKAEISPLCRILPYIVI